MVQMKSEITYGTSFDVLRRISPCLNQHCEMIEKFEEVPTRSLKFSTSRDARNTEKPENRSSVDAADDQTLFQRVSPLERTCRDTVLIFMIRILLMASFRNSKHSSNNQPLTSLLSLLSDPTPVVLTVAPPLRPQLSFTIHLKEMLACIALLRAAPRSRQHRLPDINGDYSRRPTWMSQRPLPSKSAEAWSSAASYRAFETSASELHVIG